MNLASPTRRNRCGDAWGSRKLLVQASELLRLWDDILERAKTAEKGSGYLGEGVWLPLRIPDEGAEENLPHLPTSEEALTVLRRRRS